MVRFTPPEALQSMVNSSFEVPGFEAVARTVTNDCYIISGVDIDRTCCIACQGVCAAALNNTATDNPGGTSDSLLSSLSSFHFV